MAGSVGQPSQKAGREGTGRWDRSRRGCGGGVRTGRCSGGSGLSLCAPVRWVPPQRTRTPACSSRGWGHSHEEKKVPAHQELIV